jgi:hypothetical protein
MMPAVSVAGVDSASLLGGAAGFCRGAANGSIVRSARRAPWEAFFFGKHVCRSVKPYCTASLASHGALARSLKRQVGIPTA